MKVSFIVTLICVTARGVEGTQAPTTAAPTATPVATAAPTASPVGGTPAPTSQTDAPTAAPVTVAPTAAPTNATNVTEDNCFPGDSTVQVRGVGVVPMALVRIGETVLVEQASGKMAYEPVLGFLHAQEGNAGAKSFLTVMHEHGEFQASTNHIIFAIDATGRNSKSVGDLQAGDRLLIAHADSASVSSEVYAIRSGNTETGMFAPLTPSGTLVVDGVVASSYAAPMSGVKLPHAAVHASLFLLRSFYSMGLAAAFGSVSTQMDLSLLANQLQLS